MTQCDAERKKNNTINLYTGIFDNKLFRRASRGPYCEGRPDSDRIVHDGLAPEGSLAPYLVKDRASVVSYTNISSKPDGVSATRNWQLGIHNAQDSSDCNANNLLDLPQITCREDARPKTVRDPGSSKVNERVKSIGFISKRQLDMDAGKRGLERSTGSNMSDCVSMPRSVDAKGEEMAIMSSHRSSESSVSKGNGPYPQQQALQTDRNSSERVRQLQGCSALPGELCGTCMNVKQMEDHCPIPSALLQSVRTRFTSAQAPERFDATTSSRDERCCLERSLCSTPSKNSHITIGKDAETVPNDFNSNSYAMDVVATSTVPGCQCGSGNEILTKGSFNQRVSSRQNMISEEVVMCSKDKPIVHTIKLDSVENGRQKKDSSKLQVYHSSRIQSSEESSFLCGHATKMDKSGDQEHFVGGSDADVIAWKVSQSQENSVLESPTRIGETISLEFLSSHGESSSSGSPLALEILKEGGASSPGDVSMTKGSPYSVSSRSIGSTTGYDNPFNARRSPANSNGSPSKRWQSNEKRLDEMVLNRVSHRDYDLRGGGNSSRVKPDGMSTSVTRNLTKGCQSANPIGHGHLLHSGGLLVGGANGDVLSCSGVPTKGNSKQDRTRQATMAVDCRLMKIALATSDLEEIKNAGNQYYKAGHYLEALALYDKAVKLCPGKGLHKCDRAAALSSLERLGEAVKECEEAIRLDPSYVQAHQLAVSLYRRLGMIESARQHLRDAGQHTDLMEVQRLQVIEKHLFRCTEARNLGDWLDVIKESDAAVVAGADSAPQIFGFKAEALLRLKRFHQAECVCNVAQKIESSLVDLSVCSPSAFLCLIRSQVDVALGRFDEAVLVAEAAARIEPHNTVAMTFLRKTLSVAHARTTGNDLFNKGRLFEALATYTEGLESDPANAVLLCNRAACRLKLGHWEKAVEDCDSALRAQPDYTKARLRRATCLAKLERWEGALQDYEALKKELPGDAAVNRALFDVQVAMKKSRGEEVRGMKFGGDVEDITSEEQFRDIVASAGLLMVQFITRWSYRCHELSPFIDDLCKRHPCVHFVKVDVEELPYLGRIESITFIPTFKIYKDGQKLKEMVGPSQQLLEWAVTHYSL